MKDQNVESIIITDTTLREYGQNVPAKYLHIFTPELRTDIARNLIEAGLSNIEIFSCIHPKVAPAMNEQAIARIANSLGQKGKVNLIILVPNKTGYNNFLQNGFGSDEFNYTLGLFLSSVEEHNLINLKKTLDETINECKWIIRNAVSKRIRVVAYISTVFGYFDPKEKVIIRASIDKICDYIDLFFDLGVETVTLSDLQGLADEERTREVLEAIIDKRKGKFIDKLGYHPHNISDEMAIANSKIAFFAGIRRFDSSLGGTGGCVTGAPGNQPTDRLISFFHSLGIKTSINEEKISLLTDMIREKLFSKIHL